MRCQTERVKINSLAVVMSIGKGVSHTVRIEFVFSLGKSGGGGDQAGWRVTMRVEMERKEGHLCLYLAVRLHAGRAGLSETKRLGLRKNQMRSSVSDKRVVCIRRQLTSAT